tara:strand:- start:2629 stop:3108 length:480 start_codon:yes stop_codon:yes gene_type:complete
MDIFLYATENPRNLGSIIRTSVCFDIPRLFLYDQFNLLDDEDSYQLIKRTCRRNREDKISIERVKNPLEFILTYENRYATVLSRKSKKMDGNFYFEDDALIIFGNEARGLPREISRSEGTNKFMIPNTSPDDCLSLPEAYAIVLYEYLRQHKKLPTVKR